MIRIRAERCEDGLEISAVGHAGFDARGRDVVCAGVSALLFAYLHYLRTLSPSAAADETELTLQEGRDGLGGFVTPACGRVSSLVEYRIDEGHVWVRTHGMKGADEAAWAVTRAGLDLIVREYSAYVTISDAL